MTEEEKKLRDEFVKAALAVLIPTGEDAYYDEPKIARRAYNIAESLMEERAKRDKS